METTLFSLGSWLFIQTVLFVIHYGFDKKLPFWVLWFPTFIMGIVILFIIVIFVIMLIAYLICGDSW